MDLNPKQKIQRIGGSPSAPDKTVTDGVGGHVDSTSTNQHPANSDEVEDLTYESLNKCSGEFALQQFIDGCEAKIVEAEKDYDVKGIGKFSGLQGRAMDRLENLKSEKQAAARQESERVVGINYGLNDPMLQKRDYLLFRDRVNDLFLWHDTESDREIRSKWMAPYFPIVQSSGMGKTYLLNALKNEPPTKTKCFLLECLPAFSSNPVLPEFDDVFKAGLTASKKERNEMIEKLNTIIKRSKEDRIVVCFDEAQHLLVPDDGWSFRVVRWWLRLKKPTHGKKVVAVFAGTSSKLTNFYREPQTASTTSRDVADDLYYENGSELLKPFCEITTIGMRTLHTENRSAPATEYDVAVPYGRPLFDVMAVRGELFDKEGSILRRMLLSPDAGAKWTESPDACFSALATRLQMGQVTIETAGRFVAKSYISLTHYSRELCTASVVCWPDPVLARLAMHFMMSGRYTGEEVKLDDPPSQDFWAKKMRGIFSSGLCIPARGDVGEAAAALYLLLCGDKLRFLQDRKLRTLSVPLVDLIAYVYKPTVAPETFTDASRVPRVSFTQVCRNSLRYCQSKEREESDVRVLSDQVHLRRLFDSSVATYNCGNGKAYDMLASIRLHPQNSDEPVFRPFAISIKSHETISASLVESAFVDLIRQAKLENVQGGIAMVLFHDCTCEDYPKLKRGLCMAARNQQRRVDSDFNKAILEYASTSDEKDKVKANRNKTKSERDKKSKKLETTKPESDEYKHLQGEISALTQTLASLAKELANIDNELSTCEQAAFDAQTKDIQERLEAGELVQLALGVPEDDPFGVSDLVRSTTLGPAISEVLESHAFVRGLQKMTDPARLLRAGAPKMSEEYGFLKRLIEDGETKGESK